MITGGLWSWLRNAWIAKEFFCVAQTFEEFRPESFSAFLSKLSMPLTRRPPARCRLISQVSVISNRSGCSFSLEQQFRAVYQYPNIFPVYDPFLSRLPGLDCICILRMRQPNSRC